MKWIDVKERLPDRNTLCFCFLANDHIDGKFKLITTASFTSWHPDSPGIFYDQCENITENVAYWFPVPELPDKDPM